MTNQPPVQPASELKPCPFCGGAAILEVVNPQMPIFDQQWQARCNSGDCPVEPYCADGHPDDAMAGWNTRADEERHRVEIEWANHEIGLLRGRLRAVDVFRAELAACREECERLKIQNGNLYDQTCSLKAKLAR